MRIKIARLLGLEIDGGGTRRARRARGLVQGIPARPGYLSALPGTTATIWSDTRSPWSQRLDNTLWGYIHIRVCLRSSPPGSTGQGEPSDPDGSGLA
jgi:hypothetical protein